MIVFNKPYLSGNEFTYIQEAIKSGHISGNGSFTKKCNSLFLFPFLQLSFLPLLG